MVYAAYSSANKSNIDKIAKELDGDTIYILERLILICLSSKGVAKKSNVDLTTTLYQAVGVKSFICINSSCLCNLMLLTRRNALIP